MNNLLGRLSIPVTESFVRMIFHFMGLKEKTDRPNHIPKELPSWTTYSIKLTKGTEYTEISGNEGNIEAK